MSEQPPNSFRYRAGQDGIFRYNYGHIGWFLKILPPLNDQFSEWMVEYFGPFKQYPDTGTIWSPRWHTDIEYKSVRSSRGAGNRGGWERIPRYVNFVFRSDADAILFKMGWGALALNK